MLKRMLWREGQLANRSPPPRSLRWSPAPAGATLAQGTPASRVQVHRLIRAAQRRLLAKRLHLRRLCRIFALRAFPGLCPGAIGSCGNRVGAQRRHDVPLRGLGPAVHCTEAARLVAGSQTACCAHIWHPTAARLQIKSSHATAAFPRRGSGLPTHSGRPGISCIISWNWFPRHNAMMRLLFF